MLLQFISTSYPNKNLKRNAVGNFFFSQMPNSFTFLDPVNFAGSSYILERLFTGIYLISKFLF